MSNYQLYRTNVYLGGQMKWDLVIDDSVDGLYVTKFNLTPISDNAKAAFNTYSISDPHEDNIKKYYNSNKSIFYDECLSSEFTTTKAHLPIVTNENTHPVLYCNTYDMGCKRTRYSTYKKQFEFFCPLWLESVNESIAFKFYVKSNTSDTVLSSRMLKFDLNSTNPINDNNGYNYHNAFVKYLNNYLKKVYIKNNDTLTTQDNVFEISFSDVNYPSKKPYVKLYGIDVTNGNTELVIKGKDLETGHLSFINNLCNYELPVLDFDEIIIDTFKTHKIICKQLYNFNLNFNIEDILPEYLYNTMGGANVSIGVDVYVDDILLDRVDFYTEYDYIKRPVSNDIENSSDIDINVFSYLKDYAFISNIGVNKFSQNICHWSLCDNNDYVFNLYNGFAGIITDYSQSNPYAFNEKFYGLTPNTHYDTHRINNAGQWINTFSINKWSSFYKYVKNTNLHKYKGTAFGNKNVAYINNLKYNNIPNVLHNKFVLGLHVTPKLLGQITDTYVSTSYFMPIINGEMYVMYLNDLLIFISTNPDVFTYKKLGSIITTYLNSAQGTYNNYDETNKNTFCEVYDILSGIKVMMLSLIKPKLIYYNNLSMPINVVGPDDIFNVSDMYRECYYDVVSVNYTNLSNAYVVRYDGKIKPTFVKGVNTLYYKDHVLYDNLSESVYANYVNTDYDAKYPSIGYCGIKKLSASEWTRQELPIISTSASQDNVTLHDNIEFTWYDTNKYIVLLPTIIINAEYDNADDFNNDVNDLICREICSLYNINASDETTITHIRQLYAYTYDYTYNTKYKYTITVTLK